MNNANLRPILTLGVLGTVSILLIAVVVYFVRQTWGDITSNLTPTNRIAKADQAWQAGQRQEAAAMYKKMLDLENNPLVGTPISETDRPMLYQRIIEADIIAGEQSSALRYAKQVVEKKLVEEVKAQLAEPRALDFLLAIASGKQLIEHVQGLTKLVKVADEKKDLDPEIKNHVDALNAIGFDPAVCPQYTKEVLTELRRLSPRIQNTAAAAALKSYVVQLDSNRRPPSQQAAK